MTNSITMDIHKYLERINVKSADTPTLDQLFDLQRQHLLNIPFENLDIHLGKKIVLDYDMIFRKVIHHKRGGFCYELNGLFYLLLEKLGYSIKRISARVRGDSGRIGKEGDHMALVVNLEEEDWLLDVGFGKFSFLPLEVKLDKVQTDGRAAYKIMKYDETYHGVYIREEAKTEGEEWRLGYLFTLQHRIPSDFETMCHYQQTSPDTNFTKRRMITIPRTDGRITLTDTKLKITKDKLVREIEIKSEADFQKYLMTYFKMSYNY